MATFARLSADHHTRESKPSYCSRDWGSNTEDHMELKVLTKRSNHSKADGQRGSPLLVCFQLGIRLYFLPSQDEDQWGGWGNRIKRGKWGGEYNQNI